jgi:hypothetical protein
VASWYPLSFEQRDYLNLARKDYGGVPVCARVTGPVDIGVLRRAACHVVARHEPLRMRLQSDASGTRQAFDDPRTADAEWPVVPLAPGQSLCEHMASGPDRETDGAVRFRLLAEGGERFYALALVDHLACDGWSAGILQRELWSAYRAIAAGQEPRLPPVERTYTDYVLAQGQAPSRFRQDTWNAKVADFAASSSGLTRRGAAISGAGRADVVAKTRAGTAERVRLLAEALGVSVNTVPLGCLALAAWSMAGGDSVGLWFIYAGRDQPRTRGLIGVFHRHVPLVVRNIAGKTLAQYMTAVARAVLEALRSTRPPFSAREFEAAVAERQEAPVLGLLCNQVSPSFGQQLAEGSQPRADGDALDVEPVYAHFWPCRWQSYQEQRLRVMVGGGREPQLRAIFNEGCAAPEEAHELLARTASLLSALTVAHRDRQVGELAAASSSLARGNLDA